jgi:Zn-dependent oligopeptidase
MKTSEKITTLTKALFEFQGKVTSVKKSATNPHFKKNYADLSAILEVINPIMQQCGLFVTQHPHEDVLITTVYHAETGEFMQSEQVLRIKDASNPQAQGSAITYARRYALASIFCLNQEDDDANSATGIKVTTAKETLHPKHPMWDKAVSHIKSGGSIKDIEYKFILSEDYKVMLEAAK